MIIDTSDYDFSPPKPELEHRPVLAKRARKRISFTNDSFTNEQSSPKKNQKLKEDIDLKEVSTQTTGMKIIRVIFFFFQIVRMCIKDLILIFLAI